MSGTLPALKAERPIKQTRSLPLWSWHPSGGDQQDPSKQIHQQWNGYDQCYEGEGCRGVMGDGYLRSPL